MKNIGIIPNINKDVNLCFTKTIMDWLITKGFSIFVLKEIGEILGHNSSYISCDDDFLFKNSDVLIILGGDGTILGIAEKAALGNIPILGINLGTLGYLTDVEKADAFFALEKLMHKNYICEKRMMLQGKINDQIIHELALNEICISKGNLSKMIQLNLYINSEYIDTYRADGILISTPTGSTAYNLSAGGPILKPDGNMIVITPICSHDLYSRPFVISGEDSISVEIAGTANSEVIMSMDGRNIVPLHAQDMVSINRSQYYTTIIKTHKLGFYDILRQKMK